MARGLAGLARLQLQPGGRSSGKPADADWKGFQTGNRAEGFEGASHPAEPAEGALHGSVQGKIPPECRSSGVDSWVNYGPTCGMRSCDPRDDRPAKRRPTPYRGPPVKLGRLRSNGCRLLLTYCSTGICHHSAMVNGNRWLDDTALRDLSPKAICSKFCMTGADVGPNWGERPPLDSLTSVQWRHR
jgi:hypothetical protein